jgi:heme exporter protein C
MTTAHRTHASEEEARPSAGPTGTGSVATRVLGLFILVGGVLLAALGLALTDPDVQLGERMRPIYVHVPTVSAAYVLFVLNAVGSAMWLWRKSRFWDQVAAAAAEVGLVFLGLTLLTGAFWGRITWGVYWDWDARLTSTLVMFLAYLGYVALRGSMEDPAARATRSAVVGISAALLIPLVHKSVDWWRSYHQDRTLFGQLDPSIDGLQLFTLFLGLSLGMALAAWLLIHRFRVGWLAMQAEEGGLDDALAARRAEAASAADGVEVETVGAADLVAAPPAEKEQS